MNYMLDTNIIIYLINNTFPKLTKKITTMRTAQLSVSAIVRSELEFGCAKSQFPAKNKMAIEHIFSYIQVYAYDEQVSEFYGDIRAYLEGKGLPIGENDLHIAAHAKALGYTLVSNNLRHFQRIPGLKVENWV